MSIVESITFADYVAARRIIETVEERFTQRMEREWAFGSALQHPQYREAKAVLRFLGAAYDGTASYKLEFYYMVDARDGRIPGTNYTQLAFPTEDVLLVARHIAHVVSNFAKNPDTAGILPPSGIWSETLPYDTVLP